MKITELSLRDKVLQTVCARVRKNMPFITDKIGAGFFFGEIITEADKMGYQAAQDLLQQYFDNADIPILVTSDYENGCGGMLQGLTVLPYMMGLGATNSEEIAYNYGKATALEGRSVGSNWTFSPVCDLNLNPRNPLVGVRGMTDDPDLACRLLKAVIRGMQDHGLAACAKHFPGDGVDYRDQHLVTTNNTLPFAEWKKYHGRVFQELIDSGVYSVMAGHITLPDYQKEIFSNGMKLPATLSKELITDLLKRDMGFEGVVVTDALGMGGFMGWYDTQRKAEVESFKAGCDMMLWPNPNYVDDMVEAVENGYVPMERLDDAVSRIIGMKEKLGLFKSQKAIKLSNEDLAFVAKAQKDCAENSVTLVRDKKNLFPLSPEKYKKISLSCITPYEPFKKECDRLVELLRERGFDVDYFDKKGIRPLKREDIGNPDRPGNPADYDLNIYACFSRPFRPCGFIDYMAGDARTCTTAVRCNQNNSLVVSFGSPYYAAQYFERVDTVVNAYSAVGCSVDAFVRAAMGEIPFGDFSPVKLENPEFKL